jgi:copper chaperone CopZ
MYQLNVYVGGMSCRRCVREVTARLRDVPGVETVSANPGDCIVRLSGAMQLEDVLTVFAGTTYRPELIDRSGDSGSDDSAGRDDDSGGTAAGKSER